MKKLKISDKEFETLLKKYGIDMMICFDVNQNIEYSKKQINKLIETEPRIKKYFEKRIKQ